jgi:hypothetical protein
MDMLIVGLLQGALSYAFFDPVLTGDTLHIPVIMGAGFGLGMDMLIVRLLHGALDLAFVHPVLTGCSTLYNLNNTRACFLEWNWTRSECGAAVTCTRSCIA